MQKVFSKIIYFQDNAVITLCIDLLKDIDIKFKIALTQIFFGEILLYWRQKFRIEKIDEFDWFS